MRVAVFGAGGVGGYLGARLADAGAQVHLLARGEHLAALRRDGLTLRSVLGDTHVAVPATDDPHDVGPVDHVLVCTKATDLADAASSLGPLLGEGTAVVSFLNGVDSEQVLADAIGAHHVVGGVALIFSTIEAPGVVAHTGGPARFVVGEMDGSISERVATLGSWFERAGVDHVVSDDIGTALWRKFTYILGQAGATAATGLPIGEVLADASSRALLTGLYEEACAVAAAVGIELPADTPARNLAASERLDPGMRSSLEYDRTHGKPMELDALHGTVLRLAAAHDLAVPWSRAVHAVLSPWAARNAR